MADHPFETNLMRLIAAELRSLNCIATARDMFGKGYAELGVGERAVVDQTVQSMVAGQFHSLTPAVFEPAQKPEEPKAPIGFHIPSAG